MMATVSWHLVLTLVSSLIVSCSSRLSVGQDGGYENIVVAIAPNIPEKDGAELIDNLKNLFHDASHFLHKATYNFTYFKSVTILIPSIWTSIPNVKESIDESFHAADVKITPTNGNNGIFSTIQPNGCGQPGEFIQISQDAFSRLDDATRIRRLVQHWAKYRYGVFEENGKEGSDIYPTQYAGENEVIKTGCAEPYPWEPEEPDCTKNCVFKDKGVTPMTSVMDFGSDKSYHFCDEETHKREAPTIHNILCGQKNVFDLIRKSQDLKNSLPSGIDIPQVNFTMVIGNWKKIVIITDPDLCNDGVDKVLQQTVFAAGGKFLYYILPPNFEILSLSAGDMTANEPMEFSSNKDDRLARWATLACRTSSPTSNNRNITKTVDQALETFIYGGNIILLLNGDTTSIEDLIYAVDASIEKGIQMYVFTYPVLKDNMNDNWTAKVKRREVKWFNIPRNENENTGRRDLIAWKQMDAAFLDVRNSISPGYAESTILTYSQLYQSTPEITGSFFVSSPDTTVAFSLNTQINTAHKIQLWLNGKQQEKPLINEALLIGVYYTEAVLQTGPQTFVINDENLASTFKDGYFLSIFLSSNDDQPLPQIGTVIDQTNENYVVLRVVVPSNGVAEMQAQVTANIEDQQPIIMNDDGFNGDILAHDGIYSHFFKPEKPGIYNIDFTINLYQPVQNGMQRNEAPRTSSTPLTIKKQDSFIFQGNSGIDSIPPSRIVDLKPVLPAEKVENYIPSFTWTAPGDDFNVGKVSKYELKCSTNRTCVAVALYFSSTEVDNILNITATKQANEKESHGWHKQMEAGERYFCAIRAADEAENYNFPSNVETSYVEKPPATIAPTTPEPPTQPTNPTSSPDSTDSTCQSIIPKQTKCRPISY